MTRVTPAKVIVGAAACAAAYAYGQYRHAPCSETGRWKQCCGEILTREEQEALKDNARLFSSEELLLLQQILRLDQTHLFDNWPPPGEKDHDKARLVEQLCQLDKTYTGGLHTYIKSARRLLAESKAGTNPFEGFKPSVPDGELLDFGSPEFQRLELAGVNAAGHAAFVLVAGGLGERLGFSGIKLALPADSARGACFLQVYIESILALQARSEASNPLPLAIMTSDDTHARTQDLLAQHDNFGMRADQVTLLKQEKVACLSDTDAHLALNAEDSFELQTKPHGHGDVHALLFQSGLLEKWRHAGIQWVAMFQDTNGLVFRAMPAALGVSSQQDLDVNSLAVPRAAKEAIGGIARLTHRDGRAMTINVEYNQLDPLLRATGYPHGDVADSSGFSPYPGNINQLIFKLDSYAATLQRTRGRIVEFVNPKYADESKTAFKSSTRLECMMQDFPRELPDSAKVGYTTVNQVWAAYSPVKNSPADALAKAQHGGPSHSATTGELDIYQANCRALQMLGAQIEGPEQRSFNGLDVQLWPRVSWSPLFVLTFADLKEKVNARELRLGSKAVLVVNGANVQIKALSVDGALVVDAVPGAHVTLDGLDVQNQGWRWMGLHPNKPMTEVEAIRGFKVCKHGTLHLEVDRPGHYTQPDPRQRERLLQLEQQSHHQASSDVSDGPSPGSDEKEIAALEERLQEAHRAHANA